MSLSSLPPAGGKKTSKPLTPSSPAHDSAYASDGSDGSGPEGSDRSTPESPITAKTLAAQQEFVEKSGGIQRDGPMRKPIRDTGSVLSKNAMDMREFGRGDSAETPTDHTYSNAEVEYWSHSQAAREDLIDGMQDTFWIRFCMIPKNY